MFQRTEFFSKGYLQLTGHPEYNAMQGVLENTATYSTAF